MKKLLIISILILAYVKFISIDGNINSLAKEAEPAAEECPSTNCTKESNESNDVSGLTLAVNSVNNLIETVSLAITVLTFLTALVGFIGYFRLKKMIENKAKEIDENSKDVQKKMAQLKDFKKQLTDANHLLEMQNGYISFANGYLYQATEQIVNQIKDEKMAMKIFKDVSHNYHVANLYSSDKEIRFAALAYLREKGWMSDVKHLQIVSQTDTEQQFRSLAIEIIGVIRYRNDNEQTKGTNN